MYFIKALVLGQIIPQTALCICILHRNKTGSFEVQLTFQFSLFHRDLITPRLILKCSYPVNCRTLIELLILRNPAGGARRVTIPLVSSKFLWANGRIETVTLSYAIILSYDANFPRFSSASHLENVTFYFSVISFLFFLFFPFFSWVRRCT